MFHYNLFNIEHMNIDTIQLLEHMDIVQNRSLSSEYIASVI